MVVAIISDAEAREEKDTYQVCTCFSRKHYQEQREYKIELFFNTEGPGVGKGAICLQIETQVMRKGEILPEGSHGFAFPQRGEEKVQGDHEKIPREDAEDSFYIEGAQRNIFFCEELTSNEIAAEYKEKIDAGPAEGANGVDPGRMFEYPVMKKEHKCDGEGTNMVKPVQLAGSGLNKHTC